MFFEAVVFLEAAFFLSCLPLFGFWPSEDTAVLAKYALT
jgi:hypothetical protein